MCSKFLAAELDSKCEGKRKILKTSIIGLQLYKKTISRVKVGVLLVLHILLRTIILYIILFYGVNKNNAIISFQERSCHIFLYNTKVSDLTTK